MIIRSGFQKGFSLVELLVVVAILGVLAGLAAPSFTSLIRSNRLTAAANDLVGAVALARSEALKRAQRVVLCTSLDSATCDNSASWGDGWIVFLDSDNNSARNVASEPLLRVGQSNEGVTSAVAGATVANYISFTSRGAARTTAGAIQSGVITLCIPGQRARRLDLVASGRASIVQGGVCP